MVEQVAAARAPSEALILARLERLPVTWWHVRARIYVGIATFFDAFDLLTIASALPVLVPLWKLSPAQAGYIISAAFVGQIVGALFFGWFAERYGRLAGLTWTVAIYSCASLACAFAGGFWPLVILRFIQGVGLGGEVPISGAYVNEIAKAHGRGRFFLIYEMIFGIGITCAGLASSWIVPKFGWQAMFVIGAAPAFLAMLLRRVLPESPRWLITQGRVAEADKIVTDIETFTVQRGAVLPEPVVSDVPPPKQVKTRVVELFGKGYLRRTLLIWAIWFCTYFVAYGSLTWLPTIYRTVYNLPLSDALLLGSANGVASLAAGLMVTFSIDYVGRRKWYALAFAAGSLPLLALWWIGAPDAYTVFALSALSYIFIGSNAVSVLLYTGELYPTRLRSIGTGVASTWARIAATIAPIVIGYTIAGFSLTTVFLMFAVAAIAGSIISAVFGIETRERVLEEVSP